MPEQHAFLMTLMHKHGNKQKHSKSFFTKDKIRRERHSVFITVFPCNWNLVYSRWTIFLYYTNNG